MEQQERGIAADKARIRKDIRTRIRALSAEKRYDASMRASKNLFGTVYWQNARSILVYMAMESELNTDRVVEEALASGKDVYVPKVSNKDLNFIMIRSLNDSFSTGSFGIREPVEGKRWPALTSTDSVLVLIPGLAFDEFGGRLGRGGGFYDRFIREIKNSRHAKVCVSCVGLAFNVQLIDQVPADAGDERLNALITDQQIMDFR